MNFINWIKEKLNVQKSINPPIHDSLSLTVTVVPPLTEQPAPIIKSEILAEQPIYKTFPELAIAPQPETTCFPELAILLNDHRNWLKKIRQIMRENKSCDYNPASVGTQLMSEIGKWLHGEGKQLMAFSEYHALEEAYTQLNHCAGSILAQHQRGEFLEAISMLQCDFAYHSALVEKNLEALLIRARQDYCSQCTAHNDEVRQQIVA